MQILNHNTTQNVSLNNLCTNDLLTTTKIVGYLTSTSMLWLGHEFIQRQVFFWLLQNDKNTIFSNENHSGHSQLVLNLRHANGPLEWTTNISMNKFWNLKITTVCLVHQSRVLHLLTVLHWLSHFLTGCRLDYLVFPVWLRWKYQYSYLVIEMEVAGLLIYQQIW